MRPERERKQRPWILAVDHEMTPARMEGDLAERITAAHGGHHQIDRRLQLREIDPEMRQAILKSHIQQPVRPLAHRFSRQQ